MLYCNSLFKHAFQAAAIVSATMLVALPVSTDAQAGSHNKKGPGAEASGGGIATGEAKAYDKHHASSGFIGQTEGGAEAKTHPGLKARSDHRATALAMARNSYGQAKVHTSAFARASAARIGKHKFMATADAFAIGSAGAVSATAEASTLAATGGSATAIGGGHPSATATSTYGGFAVAVAGKKQGSVSAYVGLNATVINQTVGKMTYAVAYDDLGSYSYASTQGRNAYAFTGTLASGVAVTSGSVLSAAQASMAAWASAGLNYAAAGAWASGYGTAQSAGTFAAAMSMAFASASVTAGTMTRTVTTEGKWACIDVSSRNSPRWEQCRIEHKVRHWQWMP